MQRLFLFIGVILFSCSPGKAEEHAGEKHVRLALRMIGHELLLASGDSSSRVLPVEKGNDHYLIKFNTEFELDPENLARVVKKVLAQASLTGSYLVEVKNCRKEEVVHSFKIGGLEKSDMVPCKGRILPPDCYVILFTIAEGGTETLTAPKVAVHSGIDYFRSGWSFLGGTLFLCVVFWGLRIKRSRVKTTANSICLGGYRFDKLNMQLLFKEERVELSGKESDLLQLLYAHANETVTRETILNTVWGDEGDYIGRTLDVFISRLRKKLELDASLKIVNIRGIGYKLIVND